MHGKPAGKVMLRIGTFSMKGYEFVVATLVNGEMLPLALWSIEWKGSLVSHGFYTRGGPPPGGGPSSIKRSER